MINLKIYEENNNLIFKENYPPIVCGNSNYEITFEFGSDWQSVSDKTAIIIVGGKKTTKDFSGSTLTLPAIPNCNNFMLIIFSSEGETTRLVSSPIEIEATPTSYAESLPEFAPLTTYVSELLTKINNLINGTTKVKNAESADSATIAKNVSNPNLLLNGDFRINQRGKDTYTPKGSFTYCYDRWRLWNANSQVNTLTKTISLAQNDIFDQAIEDYNSLQGKQLTASCKLTSLSASSGLVLSIVWTGGGKNVAITSADQIFQVTATIPTTQLATVRVYIQNTTSANISFSPEYIKLEVGAVATAYSPRPYAEELALCQRYYFKLLQTNAVLTGFAFSTTEARSFFNFPCEMRISPTFTLSQGASSCKIYQGSILTPSAVSVHSFNKIGVNISFISSGLTINMPLACRFLQIVEFDAEIY